MESLRNDSEEFPVRRHHHGGRPSDSPIRHESKVLTQWPTNSVNASQMADLRAHGLINGNSGCKLVAESAGLVTTSPGLKLLSEVLKSFICVPYF
jgi:hypothetical protein